MARSRKRLALGDALEGRRKELGLSQAEAARRVGVTRTAWCNWANGTSSPGGRNHAAIEQFCEWAPGSVDAVLEGRAPTLERPAIATVTQLHSGIAHAPLDDELVEELRAMDLPAEFLDSLLAAYRSEKAHADRQRLTRYLGIAREAGG